MVAIALLPLFLTACLGLHIMENVKNPKRYFKKAYRQIERIHNLYPERKSKPHSIYILIYEKLENKLIKVSAPFWMVNGCWDLGIWAAERDDYFDFGERYDIDWREIGDLNKIGPGLLVEVDDEQSKILIWLE